MKTKYLFAVGVSACVLSLGLPLSDVSAASAGQKCLKVGTLSGTKQAPLVCTKVGGKLVWKLSKKASATTTPKETVSQSNAKKSAASYLRYSSFSRIGLIGQLEYEGFSTSDATYGVDSQNTDWNAQAAKAAKSYLKVSSFSRIGLIEQLIFEGFTQSQAEYGVNTTGL